MTRIEVNGIRLNVEDAGSGPAVLLLHGFTGSAAAWRPLIESWGGFRTIAVDIIGHGASESPGDLTRYAMSECADDLAAVLDRLGVEQAAVLGYSLGGRVALRFALRYPERLRALVLESASPGIEDAAERAERARADNLLAERIEHEGIEAFVAYWEALPLWNSQARLAAAQREELRRRRLANSTLGLANSLRGMGAGIDEAVLDRLSEIEAPVLLIAGALDEKYRTVAGEMGAKIANAEVRTIENAGHATHLEQPTAFGSLVSEFLVKTSTRRLKQPAYEGRHNAVAGARLKRTSGDIERRGG